MSIEESVEACRLAADYDMKLLAKAACIALIEDGNQSMLMDLRATSIETMEPFSCTIGILVETQSSGEN